MGVGECCLIKHNWITSAKISDDEVRPADRVENHLQNLSRTRVLVTARTTQTVRVSSFLNGNVDVIERHIKWHQHEGGTTTGAQRVGRSTALFRRCIHG